MNGKIYIIKNSVSNKVYIGQTIQDVQDRFEQHLKLSKTNKNQVIYKVIKVIGKEKFFVEILEKGIDSYEILNLKEEFYIKKFNSIVPYGYNLCPGGQKWRRKSNIDEQKIISLYLSGKSARFISGIEKVSFKTILRCLKRNDIPRRKKTCNLPDRTSILTKDSLKELYLDNGLSIRKISKIVNLDDSTIRRAIRRFNLLRI